MKKLFAIITMFVLTAGFAVAQNSGKTATPGSTDTKSQTKATTKCDMQNFYCMRAGKMTQIKNGQDVGMTADATLANGTKVSTNGKLTSSKGKVSNLNEGDAIDMKGNHCQMTNVSIAEPAAPQAK